MNKIYIQCFKHDKQEVNMYGNCPLCESVFIKPITELKDLSYYDKCRKTKKDLAEYFKNNTPLIDYYFEILIDNISDLSGEISVRIKSDDLDEIQQFLLDLYASKLSIHRRKYLK